MDQRGFTRLQEEQAKAVEESKNRVVQWERFVSDYETLQERLTTLPRKLTHNVMVPITKLAFMPGHLYHTNEVLVLLGDNWFVERSTYQGHDIVERRLKFVREELKKERDYLKDISTQYTLTSNVQKLEEDVVEIKEEYDPVKEKENRRTQKQNKKGNKEEVEEQQKKELTDAQIWARLDELEKEEEEDEMKQKQPKLTLKQKVFNKKVTSQNKDTNQSDNGGHSQDHPSSVIHFTHSDKTHSHTSEKTHSHTSEKTHSQTSEKTHSHTSVKSHFHTSEKTHSHTSDKSHSQATPLPKYTSPGDIKIHREERELEQIQETDDKDREREVISSQPNKSVHWAAAVNSPQSQSKTKSFDHHKQIKTKPLPFSGQVIERQGLSVPLKEREESKEKKVSRFKASRSK